MATLQELLESDFGASHTKTASVSKRQNDDEIEKLAAELNLGDLFGKTSAEKEEEADEEEEEKEEKKAGFHGGLPDLYNTLFPSDEGLTVKTAEQEKNAAEENLGSRAYDYFGAQWDRRMDKLAADVLTGGATINASTAAGHDGAVQEDSTPTQTQADNKPAGAGSAISTKSTVVTDNVKAKNDDETVGHFEQKSAAMKLAMRKAFLVSQLEG
ncbi:MAG: hypothetical protein MUP21_00070 [Dehalococcoidia bacterium]|nr:hypothetical protein [Dehalococcoidia bacterium]